MARWIEETAGGVTIRVHAQPKAKRTEIAGFHGDAMKVRVAAPPLDGRANEALVEFLAGALGVARAKVRLISGEKGREKLLRVEGIGRQEASEKLDPARSGPGPGT